MRISIGQQIDEVNRELTLRARVYGEQVARGKMRQSIADYHIERMTAALRTLEWVRDNEDELRRISTALAVRRPE